MHRQAEALRCIGQAEALRCIGQAEACLTPIVGRQPLTEREREILALLGMGYTNTRIAEALYLFFLPESTRPSRTHSPLDSLPASALYRPHLLPTDLTPMRSPLPAPRSLFQHKIALVTGGGGGIGRALCEQLAQAGASVVVADIDKQSALETAARIGSGRPTRLDVSDAQSVQYLVAQTVAEFGRLDFMFNNAGITVLGEARDQSLDHWRRVVNVNLMGVIYGTDAAYKQMVKQGSGHIVNIASLAGLIPQPTSVPYTASKHAVVGLSCALRAEGADLGVRVSVACPAFIQANMIRADSVVNVNVADVIARRKLRWMPTAAQAAQAILRGVARNQEIIVYPFYARLLWWISRLVPAGPLSWRKKIVQDFRKLRIRSG